MIVAVDVSKLYLPWKELKQENPVAHAHWSFRLKAVSALEGIESLVGGYHVLVKHQDA